ncbi:2,3-bisphosphoglycerate-independent phosphoglycerate mutase, partial [bacterium]|nr:2,3-bisphosphoglycerate-independent phosphoglycerate mutase [bacterium]
DMVGHTGNLNAAIKAVEAVDVCLGKIVKIIKEKSGIALITADHGNAENMFNPIANQPQTAHTTNPVPFIYCSQNKKGSSEELPLDQLADVAPFILEQMNIDSPKEMN